MLRKLAFPLALVLTLALAALLVWLWSTDHVRADKCNDAGGKWDAEAAICRLELTPVQAARVSPRR